MRASAASHAEAARPQPPALPARQLRRSHGAPWQGCLKRGLALEQLRSDSLYLPRRKTQAFLEELLVVLERNDAIAEPAEFGVLIQRLSVRPAVPSPCEEAPRVKPPDTFNLLLCRAKDRGDGVTSNRFAADRTLPPAAGGETNPDIVVRCRQPTLLAHSLYTMRDAVGVHGPRRAAITRAVRHWSLPFRFACLARPPRRAMALRSSAVSFLVLALPALAEIARRRSGVSASARARPPRLASQRTASSRLGDGGGVSGAASGVQGTSSFTPRG